METQPTYNIQDEDEYRLDSPKELYGIDQATMDDLQKELDECEAEEFKELAKEEPLICWETFKSDVGFKHMILEIDIAIAERTSIKKGDDAFQQQRYDRYRKWY